MFSFGNPPGRIFINYRREDAAGVAGRLADTLGRYFGDGRVFRDIEDIEGGENFEDVLKRTAQAADAMIVLIGRQWATIPNPQGRPRLHDPDDWVAREIAAAIERKIPIFPVLVENAVMPRAEELPELLRPLVRHNAISVTDQRWNTDVTRLAKVVAIDIPGSAAERTLQIVQRAISLAIFASMAITAGIVVWNTDHDVRPPLELWQSGVTFVVIVGSVMLLLLYVRLFDPPRRLHVYVSALVGLLGTFVCFALLAPIEPAEREPIWMFFGSTVTATAVLALMNLSGFKAR
jgi:hypothetical protein